MTNEQLDKAIETAARFSSSSYGDNERAEMMRKHLKQLLEIQLKRANEVEICEEGE